MAVNSHNNVKYMMRWFAGVISRMNVENPELSHIFGVWPFNLVVGVSDMQCITRIILQLVLMLLTMY